MSKHNNRRFKEAIGAVGYESNTLTGGIAFTRAGDDLIRAGNGDTSRKALWRVSDNDLRVISRTPAGKLLQWSFSANSGGSGGSDAGTPWAMWRLRRLTELRNCYAYLNATPQSTSGTWAANSALLLYPGDAASAGRYCQATP